VFFENHWPPGTKADLERATGPRDPALHPALSH
jgi:hypothetical protein